ncbi:MAG: tRNA (guanosine(46)-N7)-methyltransferase TrmB, partial [Alphaproteobacteria bacterium]
MTIVNRRILYGRRQGRRLRSGQKALLTDGLERVAIALPEAGARVDPAAWFGRPYGAWWLEVGFG